MNIVVIREKIKEGLDVVSRITGKNENLPILKNVLIEGKKGEIVLSTTDLELGIRCSVPGKVIEQGVATAPAQLLLQMIGSLQEERINISGDEKSIDISTDSYKAKVQCLPPSDFPIIPSPKDKEYTKLTIKGSVLKSAIEQVVAATQFSDLRPELNSLLFSFCEGKLKIVSTDSFRLAEKTISDNEFSVEGWIDFRALIPLRTAHELIRILKTEDMEVLLNQNQAFFISKGLRLVSRLIEGNFPDYKDIIPKDFASEAVLKKDELANAIKLVSVLSGSVKEISVGIEKSGRALEVVSREGTMGENSYVLPAKIKKNNEAGPCVMNFNWKYFLDGVRAVEGEEISIGLHEDNKPTILRNPQDTSYFYVLMPILKD